MLDSDRLELALGRSAARLIRQIRYWGKRGAGKLAGDQRWVYNTQEEWAKQAAVSVRSIRYAVARLRKLGILQVAYLNKSPFDRTQWFYLDEEKLAKTLVTIDPANLAASEPANLAASEPAHFAGCYEQRNTQGDYFKEINGELFARPKNPPGEFPLSAGEEKKRENRGISISSYGKSEKDSARAINFTGGGEMKVNELKDKATERIRNPKVPEAKVYSLARYWAETVPLVSTQRKVVVGGKERGLMKTMLRTLGDDAPSILAKVVNHWDDYRRHLREYEALYDSPIEPNLPYLIAHLQSALDLTVGTKANKLPEKKKQSEYVNYEAAYLPYWKTQKPIPWVGLAGNADEPSTDDEKSGN